MDIGEHCTLGSCAILTFLPITCPYCRALFCQSHFLPLQHSCQAPGAADADRTLSDTEILKRVQRANQRRRDVQQGAGAGAAATPSSLLTTSASAVPDELGRQAHAASANDDADQLPNRLPCQMKGCKRFSLQMDAPNQSAISSSTAGAQPNVRTVDGRHEPRTFTHTAPRCDRCRGFFCMPHRSPVAHKCTAPAPPTVGDARRDAANERKRRAQEVLSKHFPGRGNSGSATSSSAK